MDTSHKKFTETSDQTPLFKTSTGQRSFYDSAVKILNTLEPSVKPCKTLYDFKRKLEGKLLKDVTYG